MPCPGSCAGLCCGCEWQGAVRCGAVHARLRITVRCTHMPAMCWGLGFMVQVLECMEHKSNPWTEKHPNGLLAGDCRQRQPCKMYAYEAES